VSYCGSPVAFAPWRRGVILAVGPATSSMMQIALDTTQSQASKGTQHV
jgi:hypothetical protein